MHWTLPTLAHRGAEQKLGQRRRSGAGECARRCQQRHAARWKGRSAAGQHPPLALPMGPRQDQKSQCQPRNRLRACTARTKTLRAATSRWMTRLRSRKAMAEDTPTAMTAIAMWSMSALGSFSAGRHLHTAANVPTQPCTLRCQLCCEGGASHHTPTTETAQETPFARGSCRPVQTHLPITSDSADDSARRPDCSLRDQVRRQGLHLKFSTKTKPQELTA